MDVSDKSFGRNANIDAHGQFEVPFVPEGTYLLNVSGARDLGPSKDARLPFDLPELRSYNSANVDVIVLAHDTTVGDIFVEEHKKAENTKP